MFKITISKARSNYLGPFTVREVHFDHNYTVNDVVGYQKQLDHDRFRPCPALADQRQMIDVFPEY